MRFFLFYTEIQDGRQKWRESDFCEKSPVDCRYADNLQVRNSVKIIISRTVSHINLFLFFRRIQNSKFCKNHSISHRFRDKCAFAFYAEIQDGGQKWWESNFCLKLPVDASYTLWAKNFIEIALSRTVFEISVFTFHTEIQDGRQSLVSLRLQILFHSFNKSIFIKNVFEVM